MTSTQNVQAPTQLGRHSDARENAVASEPSSDRSPSLSRTSENRWPRRHARHRHAGLAGRRARQREQLRLRRSGRPATGRPAGTSRSAAPSIRPPSGRRLKRPEATAGASTASCTVDRQPSPCPPAEAPQMPTPRAGLLAGNRTFAHGLAGTERGDRDLVGRIGGRRAHRQVAGPGDQSRPASASTAPAMAGQRTAPRRHDQSLTGSRREDRWTARWPARRARPVSVSAHADGRNRCGTRAMTRPTARPSRLTSGQQVTTLQELAPADDQSSVFSDMEHDQQREQRQGEEAQQRQVPPLAQTGEQRDRGEPHPAAATAAAR